MENEVVQVVETVEATEPAVQETFKRMPKKGKTALIVAGTAAAVVGGYFLYTKVVKPKITKAPTKDEECDEAPENEVTEVKDVEVVKSKKK